MHTVEKKGRKLKWYGASWCTKVKDGNLLASGNRSGAKSLRPIIGGTAKIKDVAAMTKWHTKAND